MRHEDGLRIEINANPVSIHAPAKGATRINSIVSFNHYTFQSTHPRRVRHSFFCFGGFWIRSFNPRTREGCDKSITLSAHLGIGFNPRTREGCDALRDLDTTKNGSFNPRTREGCDRRPYFSPYSPQCFNPRTREGCDKVTVPTPSNFRSFNPRTREGCDTFHPNLLIFKEQIKHFR